MPIAAHDFDNAQITILVKSAEAAFVHHRKSRLYVIRRQNETASKLVMFKLLIFICSTIADVITSAVADATGTAATNDSIISLPFKWRTMMLNISQPFMAVHSSAVKENLPILPVL